MTPPNATEELLPCPNSECIKGNVYFDNGDSVECGVCGGIGNIHDRRVAQAPALPSEMGDAELDRLGTIAYQAFHQTKKPEEVWREIGRAVLSALRPAPVAAQAMPFKDALLERCSEYGVALGVATFAINKGGDSSVEQRERDAAYTALCKFIDDAFSPTPASDRDELVRAFVPTHRHYKGALYCLKCFALHTEDETTLAIYHNEKGEMFARPAEMFNGLVNGKRRFDPLPDALAPAAAPGDGTVK